MDEEKRNPLPAETSDIVSEAFLKYHDYLVNYAQQKGFSKDTADDLVQEVFLRVWEKPDKYINSEKKSSWLLGILKHRIAHLQRDTQYAEQLQTELAQLCSEKYEDQLALRLIYGGIVSDKDLELLILYGTEGFSYQDLCARFGINEATCRKNIERARNRFRKALGEDQKDD